MLSPPWTARRIPVVAVFCALVFGLYGASPGGSVRLRCQPPPLDQPVAPHCQIQQDRHLPWIPPVTTDFDWIDFTLDSLLCDNTPRGGVRFCHRLTLIGPDRQMTLPEIRTPLSTEGIAQDLTQFLAGQRRSDLTWSTPHSPLEALHTLTLALLLTLTAWGFWAWQWPDPQPLRLKETAVSFNQKDRGNP